MLQGPPGPDVGCACPDDAIGGFDLRDGSGRRRIVGRWSPGRGIRTQLRTDNQKLAHSQTRMKLSPLLGPLRLPFVILTPCCVTVGVATACRSGATPEWFWVLWVLLGAIASHLSVNAFNEYFDYRSGLDATTQRTPFSGGSGTLPAHPELARATLAIAIVMLVIAAAVGVALMVRRGWALAPLGLSGLVLVVSYTTWWAQRPLACLLAPGLGLGILMIVGTHFSLTGEWSAMALVASLPVALLVSNLLLLNQFPDVDADRAVGRRNIPIVYGRPAAARLYGLLLWLSYSALATGVWLHFLPQSALLAMLTAPLAWRVWRGVTKNADRIAALVPAMRLNVVLNLLMPLLLAAGVWLTR